MGIVTLCVAALLVGWLSTLILQSDLDHLSLLDVIVGITGAGLVGGLLAPILGISTFGEYGFTLSGTVLSWLGGLTLLSLVNFMRYGHFRCGRRRARRSLP
jgi:uncharacterized membrane protein YeaQ/YmgE (transglycosylase-associated protein family)